MRPVDKILDRLERVRATSGGWSACCPAHDDRNPSLSVKEGDNDAVLIHCFAGCEVADIVAALGLQLSDLFPPKDSSSRGNSLVQRNFTRPPGARPERPERPEPADAQGAAATVTFTRADQIEFKPTAWLIDGWLVHDTLAGLVAPSGAGKSFLAIDWACRVATGSDWYGRGVEKGAVFYMAGEGQQGLRKRIAAWEKHFTVSIQGAPLFLAESLPFLCDDITTEGVVTAIEKVADALFSESGVKPALIVIDTVARAMNGANENSAEDMGQFVRSLDRIRRQWGCTVLTVHHTGHDKEAQDRARGSSAYRAALDSEFVLKPDGVDVAVRATKCKDWRTPSPLGLTKVEVELLLPQPDGTQLKESSLVLHDAPGAIAESARRDRVIALHREGKSQREIAELTKTPKTTVQRWLKAA